MEVKLIGMTVPVKFEDDQYIQNQDQDVSYLVTGAANICYRPINIENIFHDLDSNDMRTKLIDKTLSNEHMSIYEHASFNFSISGVSRALLAQLTRHRIASFSVQSQRYCSMKNNYYVIPKTIENNIKAKSVYDILMLNIWNTYNEIVNLNIPKEDARYVLPNACTTQLIMTMNIRELFHFFKLRMCKHAQWEIQELALNIYNIVEKVNKEIFSYVNKQCEKEVCFDSCGGCVLRHFKKD